MAEDTEKKFYSIMDKLFQSPKSNLPLSSSSSSVQKIRGQKRPYSAIEPNFKGDKGEGISNAAQSPPCRPWDRRDLMRRVATFKSMKWFAKPKVVDAVNCARRGWVIEDMDIIACEVCGARLQFSTPSTWSQQQVEKAALVYSLKLDSGHKRLCPWIDNACDENLALFQPLPAPVLVDRYKERSTSLLQLSALPVISASAVENVRSPQLEHFLKQSIAVECGSGLDGSTWTENLGDNVEAVSADLYYQAHRLLSLCGWEPRLLPYVVDSGEQPNQSSNNKDLSYLSHSAAGEKNNDLCVYVSGSGKENEDVTPVVHYDPNSTVLDCNLCGASIGLWAFTTVPRPLELIRVVGYAEVDSGSNFGSKISRIDNHGNNEKSDFSNISKEAALSRETSLNFSIAGGPTPRKQNFRATISLPVVGRNVRARFSFESPEIRNASEDTGKSNPADNVEALKENGVQGESLTTVADEGSNLQQRPVDNTALRKDTLSIRSAGQKENEVGEIENTPVQNEVSSTCIETDLRRQSSDKKMEFHPIRQHRHFCPWVASTGTTVPGWKQTLSALQKEKVFSLPESDDSPPSPSLIKVDDPITSIRKLFESPPTKRAKPTST